MEDLDLA